MERNIQIDKLTNNILQGKGNAQILKDRQEIFEAYYSIYGGEEINEGALGRFFKKVALTATIASLGVSAMAQTAVKPESHQGISLKNKIEYAIQDILETEPIIYQSAASQSETFAEKYRIRDIANIVSKGDLKYVDSLKCIDKQTGKIFYILYFVDKDNVKADTVHMKDYAKTCAEIHASHISDGQVTPYDNIIKRPY